MFLVIITLLVLFLGRLSAASEFAALEKALRREYATFFQPMLTEMYEPEVRFTDPLTSFSGVESYKKNVDMLGGRTFLGGLMFKDSSIVLHNITYPGRW